MCGGKIFNTWRGPGDTYDLRVTDIMTANVTSRWLPFRDKDLGMTITAPGARNQSGQSWEQAFPGIVNADQKALQENFKF